MIGKFAQIATGSGFIKAGTVWRFGSETMQFMEDVFLSGERVIGALVAINGTTDHGRNYPPSWALHEDGFFRDYPPKGVEVVL